MHTTGGDAELVRLSLAQPVYDAALEVTMCPMVGSFRTSGGVAAMGEA